MRRNLEKIAVILNCLIEATLENLCMSYKSLHAADDEKIPSNYRLIIDLVFTTLSWVDMLSYRRLIDYCKSESLWENFAEN